jgi:hypothetical protein
MALTAPKVAELEALKTYLTDWKTARTKEIDDQVAFLRRVDVSISSATDTAATSAADAAEAAINSITQAI